MKKPAQALIVLATAFSLFGCGVVGGPGNADIVTVAKKQMADNLGPAAADPKARAAILAAAETATISPKGMCNKYEGEKYACIVDVTATLPGAAAPATTQMVVQLMKGADGKWAAVE